MSDFVRSLAETEGLPPERVRLWVMVNRQNKTVRPDQPLIDPKMMMDEAYNKHGSRDKSFRLWLEAAHGIEEGRPIWPDIQPQTSANVPILVFIKHFDVEAQTLRGIGHIYVRKQSKVADMVPFIQKLMGGSSFWTSSTSSGRIISTLGTFASSQSGSPALLLYEVRNWACSSLQRAKLTLSRKLSIR